MIVELLHQVKWFLSWYIKYNASRLGTSSTVIIFLIHQVKWLLTWYIQYNDFSWHIKYHDTRVDTSSTMIIDLIHPVQWLLTWYWLDTSSTMILELLHHVKWSLSFSCILQVKRDTIFSIRSGRVAERSQDLIDDDEFVDAEKNAQAWWPIQHKHTQPSFLPTQFYWFAIWNSSQCESIHVGRHCLYSVDISASIAPLQWQIQQPSMPSA